MRVLLVEDDWVLRSVLVQRLLAEGFAVDEAETVEGMAKSLDTGYYDCVVLDRGLPDGDSVDLVARRQDRVTGDDETPLGTAAVLFLTALTDLADRLAAFAAGADDYLGKPFNPDELVARVQALCRNDARPAPSQMRWGNLVVDRATGSVVRDGVLLPLRPKEFALLEVLIEAYGKPVSSEHLLERCWDAGADVASKTVYTHMAALQRKLGPPPVIRSVRGVGYALQAPSPA